MTTNSYTGADLTGTDGAKNRVLTLDNTLKTKEDRFFITYSGNYLYVDTDFTVVHNDTATTITFLINVYDVQPITVAFDVIPVNLATIGNIAIHLDSVLSLPATISGNMIVIVDQSRQFIANYAGVTIGSNSIDAKYQPVIVDFASADAIDLKQAQSGGEKIKLAELSIDDSGDTMNAKQFRLMGNLKLKSIGKKIQFGKTW